MFADVVSVGPRVVCQHDTRYFVLLGKTDMFVLVKLFDGSIEPGTQAVGHILSTLGEPDSWLVTLCTMLVLFLAMAMH